MHLKIAIWKKQSHGLFDFTSRKHVTKELEYYLKEPVQIILEPSKETIFFSAPHFEEFLNPNINKLYIDAKTHNMTFKTGNETPNISSKMWRYLKPPDSYAINTGDVVRLGKLTFKVKAINLLKNNESKNQNKYTYMVENGNDNGKIINYNKDDSLECRICMDKQQPDNPFLSICKCSKSMPTHLNCVKEWLKAKCEISSSTNTVYYDLKNIKCEVCNVKYPLSVRLNNVTHNLFRTEVEGNQSHAVFELYEKNSRDVQGITVLLLKENDMKFTIGRSNDCDIILNDVSVSRTHAEIFFSSNKLMVKDLHSKFGTHLFVEQLILSSFTKEIHLQIEKFYLQFHVMKNKKCFCNTKSPYTHNIILTDTLKILKREFPKPIAENGIINDENNNSSYSAKEPVDESQRNTLIANQQMNYSQMNNEEERLITDAPNRDNSFNVMNNLFNEALETNLKDNLNTPRARNPIAIPINEDNTKKEDNLDKHKNKAYSFQNDRKQENHAAKIKLNNERDHVIMTKDMKTNNYYTNKNDIGNKPNVFDNKNFFEEDDDIFANNVGLSFSNIEFDDGFRFN